MAGFRLNSGRRAVVPAAPGHVATVRRNVLDALTREQVAQLRDIGDAMLTRLDFEGRMTALYDPDATGQAEFGLSVPLGALRCPERRPKRTELCAFGDRSSAKAPKRRCRSRTRSVEFVQVGTPLGEGMPLPCDTEPSPVVGRPAGRRST